MSKDFGERFFYWQFYVHYILLTIGISIIASKYGAPFDLKMFMILLLSIIVIDTIIHAVFWNMPKKYMWRG